MSGQVRLKIKLKAPTPTIPNHLRHAMTTSRSSNAPERSKGLVFWCVTRVITLHVLREKIRLNVSLILPWKVIFLKGVTGSSLLATLHCASLSLQIHEEFKGHFLVLTSDDLSDSHLDRDVVDSLQKRLHEYIQKYTFIRILKS